MLQIPELLQTLALEDKKKQGSTADHLRCHICSVSFSRKWCLLRHLTSIHRISFHSLPKALWKKQSHPTFQCHHCKKTRRLSNWTVSHWKHICPMLEKPVGVCSTKFKWVFQRHMQACSMEGHTGREVNKWVLPVSSRVRKPAVFTPGSARKTPLSSPGTPGGQRASVAGEGIADQQDFSWEFDISLAFLLLVWDQMLRKLGPVCQWILMKRRHLARPSWTSSRMKCQHRDTKMSSLQGQPGRLPCPVLGLLEGKEQVLQVRALPTNKISRGSLISCLPFFHWCGIRCRESRSQYEGRDIL